MSIVLMFMGPSGSGKSTLERSLVESEPETYHKVVSVTTREIREGEEEGVDYYFVDDEAFDEFERNGELIQKTEFAGNKYGSLRSEYTTNHPVKTLVIIPTTAKTFAPVLQEAFPDVIVKNIYFDISDERLRFNMRQREDSEEMIESRLVKDDIRTQVAETDLDIHHTIRDDDLNRGLTIQFKKWVDVQQDLEYFQRNLMRGLRRNG